ncbi:MAG TPA: acyl-CoA dehydrogenase [Paracoccus sp.]|nr:acyl-CoA dehydrogenase [Paracoccus sp. (in: a-proteobacteria)]
MQFDLNEDQRIFFDALGAMLDAPEAGFHAAAGWARFEWAAGLDTQLETSGYYDVGAEPDFGAVTAAEMVYRLARLPVVVEGAASALLRPWLGEDLPRPLAVCTNERALRFLPVARTVIRFEGKNVSSALLDGEIAPIESLFAFPTGHLPDALNWKKLDCDAAQMAVHWRVALAAEIAGNLSGALESVLEHVRMRHQFGRPLGSFQGVQHRLATASVKIEGARFLALGAAQTLDPVDAATALGYAQNIAATICYDLHQFMGAMGLTLEHPLHRWTYRARALRASLGGPSASLAEAARRRWLEA